MNNTRSSDIYQWNLDNAFVTLSLNLSSTLFGDLCPYFDQHYATFLALLCQATYFSNILLLWP
jgi:hypothetical protein